MSENDENNTKDTGKSANVSLFKFNKNNNSK